MDIELIMESFIDCDIPPEMTAKLLTHCKGGDAVNSITKYAGEIALNSRDLDDVGLSRSNVGILRYLCKVKRALHE